jgi:uncharacterized Zn finger protein
MRENAQTKATRLLVEGRISVVRVADNEVLAFVRGDSAGVYRVTYNGSRWTCTCVALGMCSHGIAVARVVVVPAGRWVVSPELMTA